MNTSTSKTPGAARYKMEDRKLYRVHHRERKAFYIGRKAGQCAENVE